MLRSQEEQGCNPMANVGYTIRVWSTGSVRYTIANHLRWVRTLVGVTDLIHRHLT